MSTFWSLLRAPIILIMRGARLARRNSRRLGDRRGLDADADGVLASFLRQVTSPRIFQLPTPIEDAVAFVDALLASPGVQLASLGPEWSKLRQLCLDKRLGGNDVPDAWMSAAVVHMGEHLVSFDRNFRKLLARGQFTLLVPA
ncbi:MAG TPA: hypothetical protein VF169_05245 [Albitalea sp.]|uniref:hypothetical protein n=1 Tax=Piscinibacter sp. TaxID=1903157 RepID=UPI002ED60434